MLDVCLLGTGGMMPLPYRFLTSLLLRYNGSSLLIDCGEGTQVALRKAGLSANPIDTILFTHYHGDHISGLPGLLLSMGNSERTEPLRIIGPRGLERVVSNLRIIAPELPFEIEFTEFYGQEFDCERKGYEIHAFRVNHNVQCYGYSVTIPRIGAFDAERAKAQEIPLHLWNRLQHGESIREKGFLYTPDMVLGPARKGLKVTYATDTRPTESIVENAKKSDLLILEGMYGDPERDEHVKERKHMLMQDACRIAQEADVPELWLTHFSPAMNHPQEYEEELKQIFDRVVIPKDGHSTVLRFTD